jgi:hypothetical protein
MRRKVVPPKRSNTTSRLRSRHKSLVSTLQNDTTLQPECWRECVAASSIAVASNVIIALEPLAILGSRRASHGDAIHRLGRETKLSKAGR